MNKKIIKLIVALAIFFVAQSNSFAGLPLPDKNLDMIIKEVKMTKLTITRSPVDINLISYKPLVLEKRDTLFNSWKNIVRSYKKKSD
jgi:hypothetical protein